MYIHIYFFFFNDTATTEIYTLSLHDALPICRRRDRAASPPAPRSTRAGAAHPSSARPSRPPSQPPSPRRLDASHHLPLADRKSTRLNSSHANISYAVFCLKKKKILISLPSHY